MTFKKGYTPWNKGISPSSKTIELIRLAKIGKKFTEEHKRKLSVARIGGKPGLGKIQPIELRLKRSIKGKERVKLGLHHFWKGGISSRNHLIRSSVEYRIWRESVFKRDNYTCIWCGAKSKKGHPVILNADHIKPFAYYPELRFAIDNGRTLCVDCHRKTDTYGSKIRFI